MMQIPIAIVCNSVPPYRLHLHRRIVKEIPEVQLWTIRTHEEDARWSLAATEEIGLVSFGEGVSCLEHGRARHALRDWRIGGNIIRWIDTHRVRAVILSGYNDLGKARILHECRAGEIPCFISGDSNIRDEH